MEKMNMREAAEQAKAIMREEYDLTAAEIQELLTQAAGGHSYDAICTAFLYGYMMGHQAAADAAKM